ATGERRREDRRTTRAVSRAVQCIGSSEEVGALSAKVAGDIATPSNAPAARDSDEQYDTKMSLHAGRQRASTLRLRALKADTKSHAGAYESPRVARIPRHFAASMQAVAASGGLAIRALS